MESYGWIIIYIIIILTILPRYSRSHPTQRLGISREPHGHDKCSDHKTWLVEIEHKKMKCKGFRVTDKLILTAAHCVVPVPHSHAMASEPTECYHPNDYKITDRSGNRQRGEKVRHKKDFYYIPKNIQYRNDIAVIRLNSSVNHSHSCWRKNTKPGHDDDKCWVYLMRDGAVEYKQVTLKPCHAFHGYDHFEYSDGETLKCTRKGESSGIVESDSGSVVVCADSNGEHYVRGLLSVEDTKDKYALVMLVQQETHQTIQNQNASDCSKNQ